MQKSDSPTPSGTHVLAYEKFDTFYMNTGLQLSYVMRKLDFGLCENKGADQLCSNCKADQRICFRFTDGTITIFLKSKILGLTGRFVSDLV